MAGATATRAEAPPPGLASLVAALDDDLNTPLAVDLLRQQADRVLETSGVAVAAEQATLRAMGALLGLAVTR
jgi:hypothetical protein